MQIPILFVNLCATEIDYILFFLICVMKCNESLFLCNEIGFSSYFICDDFNFRKMRTSFNRKKDGSVPCFLRNTEPSIHYIGEI